MASLRLSVARLSVKSSAILPIGLLVVRFAVLAAILTVVVVLFGALPLLMAARITSYNVCYTKLLRDHGRHRDGLDDDHAGGRRQPADEDDQREQLLALA